MIYEPIPDENYPEAYLEQEITPPEKSLKIESVVEFNNLENKKNVKIQFDGIVKKTNHININTYSSFKNKNGIEI